MENERPASATSRPDPDPTLLTTQQLWREIGNLEARFNIKIEAMEKAIGVAHEDVVRVPTLLDRAIESFRELSWSRFDTVDVKFAGIATQFQERDTRVEHTAQAGRVELSAALQAAKEAVGAQQTSNAAALTKQENDTKERIVALSTLMSQSNKTFDDKIAALQSLMDRSQGQGSGRRDMSGWISAGASLLLNILMFFYYVSHFSK